MQHSNSYTYPDETHHTKRQAKRAAYIHKYFHRRYTPIAIQMPTKISPVSAKITQNAIPIATKKLSISPPIKGAGAPSGVKRRYEMPPLASSRAATSLIFCLNRLSNLTINQSYLGELLYPLRVPLHTPKHK